MTGGRVIYALPPVELIVCLFTGLFPAAHGAHGPAHPSSQSTHSALRQAVCSSPHPGAYTVRTASPCLSSIVPSLQYTPRSLECPQVRLIGSLELLPSALPVDGVHLFNDGFGAQKSFAQLDHFVQIIDPLCAGTHLILQTSRLTADAVQPGFQVLQCLDAVFGQIQDRIGELLGFADLRLFAPCSGAAFLIPSTVLMAVLNGEESTTVDLNDQFCEVFRQQAEKLKNDKLKKRR